MQKNASKVETKHYVTLINIKKTQVSRFGDCNNHLEVIVKLMLFTEFECDIAKQKKRCFLTFKRQKLKVTFQL